MHGTLHKPQRIQYNQHLGSELRGARYGAVFLKLAAGLIQCGARAIARHAAPHILPRQLLIPIAIRPDLIGIQRLPVVMHLVINHATTPCRASLALPMIDLLQRLRRTPGTEITELIEQRPERLLDLIKPF